MHISSMTAGVILTTLMALITHSQQSTYRRWLWETRSSKPVYTGTCVQGRGQNYRGKVSMTTTGRACQDWNRVVDVYSPEYYGTGVGRHNFCRNPDNSAAPWCWLKRWGVWIKEFCDIPSCDTIKPTTPTTTVTTTTTTTKTTTPAAAEQDTEFTCGERNVGQLSKIVGGAYTSVSSHPWVASIFHKRAGFRCGGSLIAPCWVLTAAHCFPDVDSSKLGRLSVYLGKNAVNQTDAAKEQGPFRVKQLILHENYVETGRDFNNDIALLRIEGESGECAARTETVRTVCLPPAYTRLPPGSFCTIAGYGHDHTRTTTNYLKQGQVRLRSQDTCLQEAPEPDKVTDNMFCAASPDWETDACQRDSGGPLVCELDGRMFLFGIISFGESCAQRGKPGFYTRVTNYNKWMSRQADLHPYTQGAMYPQK